MSRIFAGCRKRKSPRVWRLGHRAIFRQVFSGRLVDGPYLDLLKTDLIYRTGAASVVLCGSGSLALELGLRACGVAPADEVVVPTFCCTAVVESILACGAVPTLCDVGPDLNVDAESVEAALTRKTRAVIVPHLFGNPAAIHAIAELASGRGVAVLDDAAQALGATIGGRPAGTWGDAGIYSFGQWKVCAAIGGGVLLTLRKGLFEKLEACMPGAAHPGRLAVRVAGELARYAFLCRRAAEPRGPDAGPARYRRESMANVEAAAAWTLLQDLDRNLAARRARAQAYREFLGAEPGIELVPHAPGSACLSQVIRVFPRKRGKADPALRVVETLRAEGFDAQGSYVPIHLIADYEKFAARPLRRAERVWSDLVELPCNPDLSVEDVARIAELVKRALNVHHSRTT